MLLRKRLCAVLLAGLLVAGLLVGFGDGDEAVAKEPRATTGVLVIPAAAFVPRDSTTLYDNQGIWLEVPHSTQHFNAPVSFPVPVLRIRKLTVVAWDNFPAQDVCVELVRAEPVAHSGTVMAWGCTSDSSAYPQKASFSASVRRFNASNNALYLEAALSGGGVELYGVKVFYSY